MPDFTGLSNFVYCNTTPNPPNVIKFTGASPSSHSDSPLGSIAINSPSSASAAIWMLTYKVNSNVTWTRLTGTASGPIDSIAVQTGTSPVLPTGAGVITMNGATVAAGTHPVRTDGTGPNTLAVEVQLSQALAAADATKVGLANFKSSDFTVTNGFVELTSASGFDWNIVSTNQSMARNNGYMVISPGGAITMALPSTASSVLGDLIEITLDGATSWQITQAAGQQIRFSSSQTTVGVGGSITTTATGDSIRLVYQASGKWNAVAAIGNLTVV